jgi:hypothetical protein
MSTEDKKLTALRICLLSSSILVAYLVFHDVWTKPSASWANVRVMLLATVLAALATIAGLQFSKESNFRIFAVLSAALAIFLGLESFVLSFGQLGIH